MKYLNTLRERRADLIAQMETIAGTAETEGRSALSTDEAAEFAAVRDEVDAIDERIGELEHLAARQADAARAGVDTFHVNRGGTPWERVQHARASDLPGLARDAVERSTDAPDAARQRITATIDGTDDEAVRMSRWALSSSDPAYVTGFAKLAAHGQLAAGHLTPAEARAIETANAEARAMSLSDASGGYMVPFTLDPSVILSNAGDADPMRQIARAVTITTDTWNGVRSAGVAASWDAEAAAVSDDTPTLAQPTITTHKGAAFVPYSIEVGGDAVALADELRRLIADGFDRLEAAAFWTGSGSGEPRGLITALDANTNVEVATTTNDTFGVVDVYKLHEALPPRYRRVGRPSWAADIQVLNKVRRFGEGTTGSNSAFWADLAANTPSLLLGAPVYEASSMESFDGTGTENILVVGDFSNYVIVDRVGTTVELIPHLLDATTGRPTGQRGMYAYKRVGADSVNDLGFRLLQA